MDLPQEAHPVVETVVIQSRAPTARARAGFSARSVNLRGASLGVDADPVSLVDARVFEKLCNAPRVQLACS